MATAMACVNSFPILSYSQRRSTHLSFLTVSANSLSSKKSFTLVPGWGLGLFSSWNSLKHLAISIRHLSPNKGKKGNCRGKAIFASLFGVGAPEALVIGVVALLVFGPKGLAEVARNLGKTLRAFQPTIRELQEVSRDFRSTLEREIGLDEVSPRSTLDSDYLNSQAKVNPNGKPTPTVAPNPSSNEDLSRVTEVQPSASTVKQQTEIPAPQEQPQDGTSPTARSYASEELLKVTEENLTALAAKQQATMPTPEEQSKGIIAGMPSLDKPENEG